MSINFDRVDQKCICAEIRHELIRTLFRTENWTPTRENEITVVKPVPMILLLIPNCGADNAGTKFIFFLLSSIAIQFMVRIKLSGSSDPSATGVEISLNAG